MDSAQEATGAVLAPGTAVPFAPTPELHDEKVPITVHGPVSEDGTSPPVSLKNTKEKAAVNSDDGAPSPFAHLPVHERALLEQQVQVPAATARVALLLRYAKITDWLIMAVAGVCAAAGGAVMPLMTITFGNIAGSFQGIDHGTLAGSAFQRSVNQQVLYFVYLAIGEFVTVYVATVGFMYTGQRITQQIREHYLAAILRQNVAFFDKLGPGEIATRITSDTNLVQDGISQKVALTISSVAAFVAALIISFTRDWRLALILMAPLATIVAFLTFGFGFLVGWVKKSLEAYAIGGSVAEEVLASIRVTTAFSTQEKLARQYDSHLINAAKWGRRRRIFLGMLMGTMYFLILCNYALAFWQGSRYLVAGRDGVNVSTILTIMMAMMISSFELGKVGPNLQAFATATAAAGKIFATIDRVSPLDASDSTGSNLEDIKGEIELRKVRHIYPSRPEVVVLDDFSLHIPAGKTTALVGASGCGKSTVVGLIERFYDCVGGGVFVDGNDVKQLNLRSLRRHTSLVSQEPMLFGTTVFENIAHGLIGTDKGHIPDEKKSELVIDAAKMANAHDFIQALPDGYETSVGNRGLLLSGGQKQRIAIARAIISDPKILLLDEATSALDTKSEGVVQLALDKASQGRTTVTIAHRLSSIKNADNIVVMANGAIVEQGTHNELLLRKSAYFKLVETQQISALDEGGAQPDTNVPNPLEKQQELAQAEVDQDLLPQSDTTDSTKPTPSYSLWALVKLVSSLNKQERLWLILGTCLSILAGLSPPAQSVFFAKSIVALILPPSEYGLLRSQIDFWAGMYTMLGVAKFVLHLAYGTCFAYCSEGLIRRVRDRSFRTMLRQDISFHDKQENSSGALTSFLSTRATQVAGLSGETLGTIVSVSATLIGSFIVAIAIAWKLALVCIATVPVILGCGFFRCWVLERLDSEASKAHQESAAYACEATSAIRTVASLGREQDVWNHYHRQLVDHDKKSTKSVLKSSALYATTESATLLCTALAFWWGSKLIARGEYSIEAFYIAFACVIFGSQSAGNIFSFAPDMTRAKTAASALKTLFDHQPVIDIWSSAGQPVKEVAGAVEFKNVHFHYPTRPSQPVLRGLNLSVKPGQYIALVGGSGCGKSTSIALLERFYDPSGKGQILLDGVDITTLNLLEYRSHLSLVSQEPTLYTGTIRENILFGARHDTTSVTDKDVERACRDANILDFIHSLPDGFETQVGGKGLLLSGGQKQRIAIARALVRDPKVLLLDEATSALDGESEKVVQEALDRASRGRTTIAVAHRLSTIQRADCIFVIEGGVVVEQGTHEELLRLNGKYSELVGLQGLEGKE